VVTRRAVFLDRDGVINRAIVRDGKPYAARSLEEFEILPGVAAALEDLRTAGFLNIVVTNQPDVGANKIARDMVEAMHAQLLQTLPVDAVKACYHVESDNCECRKPKPGMILQAAREHHVDVNESFLVGDRWRDVAAGQRAGCKSFFIDSGYAEKRPEKPYVSVKSLPEAAQLILQSER
jgi:D-glycero-D-manno-heptose 1,7-bisphosphate phosphatase